MLKIWDTQVLVGIVTASSNTDTCVQEHSPPVSARDFRIDYCIEKLTVVAPATVTDFSSFLFDSPRTATL